MGNTYPSEVLQRFLATARFEVLPTASVEGVIRESLPPGTTVTVTASPSKSIEATLALAVSLAEAGYDAVPHLAARMISGRAELGEIVDRLRPAGITKVFVPAGDAAQPAGDYASSLDLLLDLDALGRPFAQVAITGYPESHPSIDDDVTIQSMWDKRQYATHIISNMTFDDGAVGSWVERLRRRGVGLPVLVGVPGPVERAKLLGMASKIGVGDSMRFLVKQKGVLARIASPGFSTDRFVDRIAALAANRDLHIEGLHLFTFNQVAETGAWRTSRLERP